MFGWLRPAPWPPQLEEGETVLLEGRASMRRFWLLMALSFVLFMMLTPPIAFVLDHVFQAVTSDGERVAFLDDAAQHIVRTTYTVILLTAFGWWELARAWMLTSHRFIQQGKGAIPRDEIGAVKVAWPDGIVIHRAGKDELLKGLRFTLGYLDDARGMRDALERLK